MLFLPVWGLIGMVIYFVYSRSHSHLGRGIVEVHDDDRRRARHAADRSAEGLIGAAAKRKGRPSREERPFSVTALQLRGRFP